MELQEIELSPERAKVGLDIRVVGYVKARKKNAFSLCFYALKLNTRCIAMTQERNSVFSLAPLPVWTEGNRKYKRSGCHSLLSPWLQST